MMQNGAAVALILDNYKYLPKIHIKLSTREPAAALKSGTENKTPGGKM